MKSYSPYDNLAAKPYPDDPREDLLRRQPGHVLGAAKYVANCGP